MVIECKNCTFRGAEREFEYGRGRQYGEHENHRYCPRCHLSIDWCGFLVVPVQVQHHVRRPVGRGAA